jgi:hypothetical protein
MIRRLLLLLALSGPAQAETARVLSGEHGDFTRLVIELPDGAEWQLGRTPNGYAFALKSETQPDYDLAAVWQRISRTRLQTLQRDSVTGALALALGCECHIFPFEYRTGVVVLDIKPGPAPEGSAFEAAFAGPGPDLATTRHAGETVRYDWLADPDARKVSPPTSLPLPLDTGSVSLEPLRDELLQEIARGAADGIIDMELPGKPHAPVEVDHAQLPWSQVRIGEDPGVLVTDPDAFVEGELSASACADPVLLDLPAWDKDLAPNDLLAATRGGLFGEFDAPDSDAILTSIQGLLYLGFGAEAQHQADLVEPDPEDQALPLYRSMARIVDGESDPQTPFASMLDCDGPAALWAALAHDRLPAGRGVNRDAILQAFAALPAHLRRHLGAGLAEKFLARDDAEAARMIRDAMERAPDADKAAVALLDAQVDLHGGDTGAAIAHAETAVALDGDQADTLVALVETHFRKMKPLTPETAQALLAMQGESEGTPEGPAVTRAVVLALALSGQFDAAFDQQGLTEDVVAELWQVTQAHAPDDTFLTKSVLPMGVNPPVVQPGVKLAVAGRLLALGFPDAAQDWLGPVDAASPPDRRLLAARAAFGRGDARSAVALLEGLADTEADRLRANALLQLGDLAAAGTALTAAGAEEEAARLGPWRGDWAELDPSLPDPWLQAADLLNPEAPAEAKPLLARGGQAVEASLASRQMIEALLASVVSPSAD